MHVKIKKNEFDEAKYRSQDPDSIVLEFHMTQTIFIGWQPD